jgi:hypothetical protein
MCCFSGPVEEVAATRIFARASAPGRQVLAYEMQLAAAAPVAMILPVPVPAHSADDAVRFISLEGYPALFADLHRAFHPPTRSSATRHMAFPQPALAVHAVGAFVASFVPALRDFGRLDPRFRIPPGTIDRVDGYADWGFVVFQLGETRGKVQVHPMAFEFPTRSSDRLFFPLVHVHDGSLPSEAEMDHVLYAQGVDRLRTFDTLPTPARQHVAIERAKGLFDPAARISRCERIGTYPNRDLWVTLLDAM